MKKLCLLFLCFFTTDSFASGIASNTASAPCTNNTLETYSGNSNLSADWQPNEIHLRWYNNNTQITPTNTNANTCTYDGSLAIPQNAPTRTGYTFAGWEVVPEYDFSTFDANTKAIYTWSKADQTYCMAGTASTAHKPCNNGEFDDLGEHEWKTQFSYGMIYGTMLCSVTVGTTLGETGTPNETTYGEYCWCKATGFMPTNDITKYAPTKSPKWVYARSFGSDCNFQCADWCSAYSTSRPAIRVGMFK